jgi:hypothetical protein
LGTSFDLPRVILEARDNFSRLIDKVERRLAFISGPLDPPSRERNDVFFLLVRDLDAFSEPMRERHFRTPKKALRHNKFDRLR